MSLDQRATLTQPATGGGTDISCPPYAHPAHRPPLRDTATKHARSRPPIPGDRIKDTVGEPVLGAAVRLL